MDTFTQIDPDTAGPTEIEKDIARQSFEPGRPETDSAVEFVERLESLREAHAGFMKMHRSASDSAYDMLGRIHELASLAADPDSPERKALIDECMARPDVAMAPKWKAAGQTGYQLLTTRLFGVEKDRPLKCNWNNALGAADYFRVPPNADAVVSWLKGNGGIEGVTAMWKEAVSAAEAEVVTDVVLTVSKPEDMTPKARQKLGRAITTLGSVIPQPDPLPDGLPVIRLNGSVGVLYVRFHTLPDDREVQYAFDVPNADRFVIAAASEIEKAGKRLVSDHDKRVDGMKKRWRAFMLAHYHEYNKQPDATTLEFGEFVQENEHKWANLKPEEIREYVVEW